MTALQTDSAKYTIYIDENKYWLQIKQLSENNYIHVEVEKFYNLLVYGGELSLDYENSNITTLTFNLSKRHLRTERNYINTWLTDTKGYYVRLINMLLAVKDETSISFEEV